MIKFVQLEGLSGKPILVNLDNVTSIHQDTFTMQSGIVHGITIYFNARDEETQACLRVKNSYSSVMDFLIEQRILFEA